MKNGKIWVALMEKAWAKLHGRYGKINAGGWPHFVWPFFTSLPSYVFDNEEKSEDELWERIQFCDGRDYAIQACTPQSEGGDRDIVKGIVQSHAYTLLSAHQV